MGPGPLPPPPGSGFAGLRLHQLRAACRDHAVTLVDARSPPARVDADVVVSAGIFGPTRAALALAGDRPLWLDLPGDPFADTQAAAARAADPEAVNREADLVFGAALRRGDRFGAVSGPSRHALLGALGAVGRLGRSPPEAEWVDVVPVAWWFGGLPERPPRPPGRPLRVALSGSFNTWFDEDTALAALLRLMDEVPAEVEVTGGPVPGHHEAGWARFRAGAAASRHAARFRFHGWLDEAALGAVLARCHVGLCLDRPGYEPEMGSRTRVLCWLHQGLSVVATARTELAQTLAAEGHLVPVPMADPLATAEALATLPDPRDRSALRARWSVEATVAPLRRWLAAPTRAPAAPDATAALRAVDEARAELAALRASPTWRALDRLHRLRRSRRGGGA